MARQRGFSYVVAMFLVAVLSVLALRGVQVSATNERREQEARLMDVGLAYRQAIRSYVEDSPGTVKTYPSNLEALLSDDRTSTLRRHLRKLYPDPITGGTFGLIRTEDGRIKGVHSLSERVPIKQDGFPAELAGARKAQRYSDWQFTYLPNEAVGLGERK